MVLVSPELLKAHLTTPRVAKMFNLLERDIEVRTTLEMSNVMTVKRLVYNDHGIVHARIVVGSAFELFNILSEKIEPSLVRDGIGDLEDRCPLWGLSSRFRERHSSNHTQHARGRPCKPDFNQTTTTYI